MLNLITNNAKILSTCSKPLKIGYDIRIYKEYGSLPAALTFNMIKVLSKKGTFGLTDQEFSKQLGLSLNTFKRAKLMLKDRACMKIGVGNKTYYEIKKDMEYDPLNYRGFDLRSSSIMNGSFKGGAFLGQCLHWWNKSLEKGKMEFSMSDKQIIRDLPFLSQDI